MGKWELPEEGYGWEEVVREQCFSRSCRRTRVGRQPWDPDSRLVYWLSCSQHKGVSQGQHRGFCITSWLSKVSPWRGCCLLRRITDSVDTSLSKLQEMMKNRKAWRAAIHGVAKNWTWLNGWTTTGQIQSLQRWLWGEGAHVSLPAGMCAWWGTLFLLRPPGPHRMVTHHRGDSQDPLQNWGPVVLWQGESPSASHLRRRSSPPWKAERLCGWCSPPSACPTEALGLPGADSPLHCCSRHRHRTCILPGRCRSRLTSERPCSGPDTCSGRHLEGEESLAPGREPDRWGIDTCLCKVLTLRAFKGLNEIFQILTLTSH